MTNRTTATSDMILAGAVSSALDYLERDLANTSIASNGARLFPHEVKLNGAASIEPFLDALRREANSEFGQNLTRAEPHIPTADRVTHNSFKVDSKLVIRVVQRKARDDIAGLFFNEFSLQGTAENDEEKYQLHETFEGSKLYLFGRRPRIWTFQGVVVNGRNEMDFADELMRKYNSFYRGSKAVENDSIVFISYEDVFVEGTIISMTPVRNVQIPTMVNMTFTMVVHDYSLLGDLASIEELEDVTASLLEDAKAQNREIAGRVLAARPTSIQAESNVITAQSAEAVADAKSQATTEEVSNLQTMASQLGKDLEDSEARVAELEEQAANELDPELRAALEKQLAYELEEQDRIKGDIQDTEIKHEQTLINKNEAVEDKQSTQVSTDFYESTNDQTMVDDSADEIAVEDGVSVDVSHLSDFSTPIVQSGGVVLSAEELADGQLMSYHVRYQNGFNGDADLIEQDILVAVKQ